MNQQLSVLICCLTMLSGCSFFRDLVGLSDQPPKVQLQAVDIKEINKSYIMLELGLMVENPNGFELTGRKLRYVVRLGDKIIGEGQYPNVLKVGAESNATARIPLKVYIKDASEVLAEVFIQKLRKGKTDAPKLRVDGSYEFKSPFGFVASSFSKERKVKL